MRFTSFVLTAAISMMVAGCQQAKTVDAPPKQINLLGELQTRSEPSTFTSSPQREESGIVVNTLGMRMVPVQPATFWMGSPMNEAGRQPDELRHEVRVSKRYHIATTEVTQSQWLRVMRTEPWRGQKDALTGKDQPATHMTHAEAMQFCAQLTRLENVQYRLPTEAEWELACRAGMDGPFGSDGSPADLAWTDANAPANHAAAVAKKQPNGLGLFDMHGNIAEWCGDWYAAYPRSLVTDPMGPATGEYRVVRGGAWDGPARFSRSAYRAGVDAETRSGSVGLRVVMVR